MADDGKVVGGKARAHGRLVFAKLDIEAPVKPVFHLPMAAHRPSNPRRVRRQGASVVAALVTGLGANRSLALHDRTVRSTLTIKTGAGDGLFQREHQRARPSRDC